MVGADGHLFLYSTRAVVRRILGQNLEANQVAHSVTVMRRELAQPREASSAASGAAEPRPPPGADYPTETLDELQLERLDLLKIRSDASAAEILDGASSTLWRLRPVLFIDAQDVMAVANLSARVKEFGYRCWRVDTPLFNPDNFNRRDTDIFPAESVLALLGIPEEVDIAIALDGCVEVTDGYDGNHNSAKLQTVSAQDTPPNSAATLEKAGPRLLRLLRKLLR
jgi:hypothetical protein